MKYRLMDILACPICKKFPLELIVIESVEKERKLSQKAPLCELYCAYRGDFIKNLTTPPPCEECFKREIETGVLYCPGCGRWYPIINGIPHMLPDYIRKEEKNKDIEFLKKYKDKLPEKIWKKGMPYNLGEDE
ncbi:Trm112 family protein [Fervidicoccus fontis]|nr:Trm112 family protein [Fervidicoccus fontis]MBE9391682.1 Trm112 family protein [Fervidicoccus fontis]